MTTASDLLPQAGEIVCVRSRRYLVEDVKPAPQPGDETLVRLSCLEDDAEGEELDVLWEKEVDAQRIDEADWSKLARGEFDPTKWFAAYCRTLALELRHLNRPEALSGAVPRGHPHRCLPARAAQEGAAPPAREPVHRRRRGPGKTIEAGLIVRELLMRQRVRRIVVAAPPSVVLQWKDELDQRFGLTFVVFDRDYVRRMRMERGFGVNPWTTHTRFIVSHVSCATRAYASPCETGSSNSSGEPADPRRSAQRRAGQRHTVRHRFAIHAVVRELGPPLRASALPVGDAAQRPLEQLLGAPGDPRSATVLPWRAC